MNNYSSYTLKSFSSDSFQSLPVDSVLPSLEGACKVAVIADYQNLIINSARQGLPIDLRCLSEVLAKRYNTVSLYLFSVESMAPPPFKSAPNVTVKIIIQQREKNCDMALTLFALRNRLHWYKERFAVIFATGDSDFLELADELSSFGKGIPIAFLAIPGYSTSSQLISSPYDVGYLGRDARGKINTPRSTNSYGYSLHHN